MRVPASRNRGVGAAGLGGVTAAVEDMLAAREGGEMVIAVAMSGGVDSSVVAALLQRTGARVMGVTALMTTGHSRCCSDEDVKTAAAVAGALGIEHHTIDLREMFEEQIIRYFMAEYLAGRTPSPCGVCNRRVKFGALLEEARQRGATHIATGHYARVSRQADGLWHLRKGVDGGKDQSYFLFGLGQDQLARSLFPLGGLAKPWVVEYAEEAGLACRASRESQELCFVDDIDHGTWIDVRSFETGTGGKIVDVSGRELGEHPGVHHFTIGQRRGLGIATGRPVYVVALDARENRVVVGDRADAMAAAMMVKDVNWLVARPSSRPRLDTQIRYNHRPAPSTLALDDDGGATVVFDEPQFAITPGQIAAFYDGDELLGGGWIEARR